MTYNFKAEHTQLEYKEAKKHFLMKLGKPFVHFQIQKEV